MRDAEEIIHRAINRVHHPAIVGIHHACRVEASRRRAGATFLSEQRNLGKRGAEGPGDEVLAAHVQFEFDVVGVGAVDAFGLMPVGQHEFPGGARGLDGNFLCGV